MKLKKLFVCNIFLLLAAASIAQAPSLVIRQTNESGIYQPGDKARVVAIFASTRPDSVQVKIRKDYAARVETRNLWHETGDLVLFDEKVSEPGSYIFEVTTKSDTASLGFVTAPDKLTPGTKRPADFEAYWSEERNALRALAMEVKTTAVSAVTPGFKCVDVEINCTGPKPARGYFARPTGAAAKSLPIVLYLHAAGVKGSWCRSEPGTALRYAKMGKGCLAFDLNAHGMLNGQPDAYYADLEKGELRDYYFQGVDNRSGFYFRGMYLRLMRALDYLTSLPEWDGKRILVIGESQGGGQALAAAGLDSRVTAAVATVPAMCDWGPGLQGRIGGWPNPFSARADKAQMLETLPYFDAAHLLKNSKATLVVEIGLIDITCPSISVYAAVNQADGKKIVYAVPYRGHHVDQKAYQPVWDQTVRKSKDAFVSEYLQ